VLVKPLVSLNVAPRSDMEHAGLGQRAIEAQRTGVMLSIPVLLYATRLLILVAVTPFLLKVPHCEAAAARRDGDRVRVAGIERETAALRCEVAPLSSVTSRYR